MGATACSTWRSDRDCPSRPSGAPPTRSWSASSSRAAERAEGDRKLGGPLLVVLPGALTAYRALHSGGYFPRGTAVATLIVAAALIVRVIVADAPLAGLNRPLAIAAGALMLYGVWTLLSADWSHASSRAL